MRPLLPALVATFLLAVPFSSGILPDPAQTVSTVQTVAADLAAQRPVVPVPPLDPQTVAALATGGPNLRITDLELRPLQTGVVVLSTVTNDGQSPALSFLVRVSLAPPSGMAIVIDHAQVPTLAPGDSRVVPIAWPGAVPGLYQLRVFVDSQNSVLEKSEVDNTRVERWVVPSEIAPSIPRYQMPPMVPLPPVPNLSTIDVPHNIGTDTDPFAMLPEDLPIVDVGSILVSAPGRISATTNDTLNQEPSYRRDIPTDATKTRLFDTAWVKATIASDFGSSRPFEVLPSIGTTFIHFLQGEGDATWLVPAPPLGSGLYTLGSPATVSMTERAMKITVLQYPTVTRGTNGETITTGSLTIDFSGSDTSGQTVRFNRDWVVNKGLWSVKFENDDGPLRHTTTDDFFTVEAPHFSTIRATFDSGTDGFTIGNDPPETTVSVADGDLRFHANPFPCCGNRLGRGVQRLPQTLGRNQSFDLSVDFRGILLGDSAATYAGLGNCWGCGVPSDPTLFPFLFKIEGTSPGATFGTSGTTVGLQDFTAPLRLRLHYNAGFGTLRAKIQDITSGIELASYAEPRASFAFNYLLGAMYSGPSVSQVTEAALDNFQLSWIDGAWPAPDPWETTATTSTTTTTPSAPPSTSCHTPAPQARQSVTVAEDSVANLINLADRDWCGNIPTAYRFTEGVKHGAFSISGTCPPVGNCNRYEYTPEHDYSGPDRFAYRVCQGLDCPTEIIVSINVVGVNDPPIAGFTFTQRGLTRTVVDFNVEILPSFTMDPDDALDSLVFFWTWGDGTTTSGRGTTWQHLYPCVKPSGGTYTVSLRVQDPHGAWSLNTASKTLTTSNGASDSDALDDCTEERIGTNPRNPQTDGDGVSDSDEYYDGIPIPPDLIPSFPGEHFATHPLYVNVGIARFCTNPAATDTDGDSLTDKIELYDYGTYPTNKYLPPGAGKCHDPANQFPTQTSFTADVLTAAVGPADMDNDGVVDGNDNDPHTNLRLVVEMLGFRDISDTVDDFTNAGNGLDGYYEVGIGNAVSDNRQDVVDDTDDRDLTWRTLWNVPDEISDSFVWMQLMDEDSPPVNPDDRMDTGGGLGIMPCMLTYYYDVGQWTGDDYPGDANGYGHCSGAEDGIVGSGQDDGEVWFRLYQEGANNAPDADGDRLPFKYESVRRPGYPFAITPGRFRPGLDPFVNNNVDRGATPPPTQIEFDADYYKGITTGANVRQNGDGATSWQEYSMGTDPLYPDVHGFKIRVYFKWQPMPQEVPRLLSGLRHFSNFLYEATDGRFFISRADVHFENQGPPGQDFPSGPADIVIYRGHAAGLGPHWPTSPVGGWFLDGTIYRNYIIMSESFDSAPHEIDSDGWARALVHEFGHNAFSLFDEYERFIDTHGHTDKNADCPSSGTRRYMAQADEWKEFAIDADDADPMCQDTMQWQVMGEAYNLFGPNSGPNSPYVYRDPAVNPEKWAWKKAAPTSPNIIPSDWRMIFDQWGNDQPNHPDPQNPWYVFNGPIDMDLDSNHGSLTNPGGFDTSYTAYVPDTLSTTVPWDEEKHPGRLSRPGLLLEINCPDPSYAGVC